MKRSDPTKFRSQSVNLDVSTRRHAHPSRPLAIRSVRVRNMKRFVEFTTSVFPIDCVQALRRFVIARAFLFPDGHGSERNLI